MNFNNGLASYQEDILYDILELYDSKQPVISLRGFDKFLGLA